MLLGGSPHPALQARRGCRQPFRSSNKPGLQIGSVSCSATSSLSLAPKATESTAVVLPPSLKNNVAVLEAPNPSAPGGKTLVYLLAMSHVSQRSVEQVDALIRCVRPQAVAVELCKERSGLLVDPEDASKPPKLWHSRKISIEGLPGDEDPAWPQEEQLRGLLVCRPGRPVTQQDIEGDVLRLLSTGLFASVRPGASNAGRDEAAEFLVRPAPAPSTFPDGGDVDSGSVSSCRLALVPPLGTIRFKVAPRSLPAVTALSVRVDSSLKAAHLDVAALEDICVRATDDCRTGASGLTALLRTRQRVIDLAAAQQRQEQVTVSFSGVDTGRVEMIVKAVKPTDPPYMSGLESSAVNGEGFGIDPFRPQRSLMPLGKKMFLPSETLDAMRAERLGAAAAAAARASTAAGGGADEGTSGGDDAASGNGRFAGGWGQPVMRAALRPWTPEELAAAPPQPPPQRPVQDTLAGLMSTIYARIQSKAARTVGLEPGAAWRAALQAATEVGCGVVVLADRPADITQHRMGPGLVQESGGRLAGSLALLVGSLVGALASGVVPKAAEPGLLAAGLAAAVAVAAPVVSPFLEVSRFADMSAEAIEDAVAVKEPIDQGDLSKPLKLFGEDALLDWPGALPALIHERDEFMAKAIAALATGRPGVCPAYVLDTVDGQTVWRYGMAEGGASRSAPAGQGDGALTELPGMTRVVGVVGSAHVRGMVRQWQDAVRNGEVEGLLADAE